MLKVYNAKVAYRQVNKEGLGRDKSGGEEK